MIKKNIVFEAADLQESVELILFEVHGTGEFELHVTKDMGISEDGKEFVDKSIVMKLGIEDFARLIDSIYPYLKREGIET